MAYKHCGSFKPYEFKYATEIKTKKVTSIHEATKINGQYKSIGVLFNHILKR